VERRQDDLLYLPADAPLTGFEEHMPHLRRADGRAVMLPSYIVGGFHGPDDNYRGTPFFTYADEDFLLTLGRGREWVFATSLAAQVGGRRLEAGPFAIAGTMPSFKRIDFFRCPASYQFWRRVVPAFVDAWLTWPGTERRMLDDHEFIARERARGRRVPEWEKSGASLARADAVSIEGGYLGGIYVMTWRLNAQDGARRAQAERAAPGRKRVTGYLERIIRALWESIDVRPQ
jgi:hypothetical protein